MNEVDNIYGKKLLFIVLSCFTITDKELSLNDVFMSVIVETSLDPIPVSEDNLKRRIRDKLNCLSSLKQIEKIKYKNNKKVVYFKYKRV